MKRFFYLLLLLNLLPLKSSAEKELDSLKKVLSTTKDDSLKASVLNDLCFKLCYSDQDAALDYGSQAIEIGSKLESPFLLAKSYNRIGIVFDIKSEWDTAMVCYKIAINHAKQAGDTVSLASAYNNMGLIHWNRSQYDLAVQNYIVSLEYFEQVDRPQGVAHTYNNISLIYWEQDSFDLAMDYQQKALELRKEIKDDYGISASLINIGLIKSDQKKNEEALDYFYRGIRIKEKLGYDLHGLAIAYNDIATSFNEIGSYDSATFYYKKAIELHRANQNHSKLASSYMNLADNYRYDGKFDLRLEYLLKAEKIADSIRDHRMRRLIYEPLAAEYGRRGEFQKATMYHKKYKHLNDSLFTLDKNEQLTEALTKFETEKKEKEILELKAQKAEDELLLAEKSMKAESRKKWIFSLIGGILLLVLFAIVIFLWQKNKAAKEKEVIRNEEQEKSMEAVFDATEEERQRIARDLHDGVGQQMSGLKMAWSNLTVSLSSKLGDEAKKLEELTGILDATASEVRDISHRMMPKVLEEYGLIEAIREMLDKSLKLTDIDFEFDHFNIDERPDRKIELSLYRVTQELINNIIKHSGATFVSVQLFKNGENLILIVEDNGRGMEQGTGDGYGLMNIKSRLTTIDGRVNYGASIASGTIATIRIRMKKTKKIV